MSTAHAWLIVLHEGKKETRKVERSNGHEGSFESEKRAQQNKSWRKRKMWGKLQHNQLERSG